MKNGSGDWWTQLFPSVLGKCSTKPVRTCNSRTATLTTSHLKSVLQSPATDDSEGSTQGINLMGKKIPINIKLIPINIKLFNYRQFYQLTENTEICQYLLNVVYIMSYVMLLGCNQPKPCRDTE